MTDSISMKEALSPLTYEALEKISLDREWADIAPFMEPEQVAWLVFKLEFVEDTNENFPRGRWATIQRINGLVRLCAENEGNRGETK